MLETRRGNYLPSFAPCATKISKSEKVSNALPMYFLTIKFEKVCVCSKFRNETCLPTVLDTPRYEAGDSNYALQIFLSLWM